MKTKENKNGIRYKGVRDGPILLILLMVAVMVTVSGRY